MTAKAQPCQHASYCPRRMRDGDHIGCADRGSVRGCTPSTERPELDRLMFQLVQMSSKKVVDSG